MREKLYKIKKKNYSYSIILQIEMDELFLKMISLLLLNFSNMYLLWLNFGYIFIYTNIIELLKNYTILY